MSYTRKSRIAQFLFLTTAMLGFTLAAVYEHYRLAAAAMAVPALGLALKLIFGGSVEPRGGRVYRAVFGGIIGLCLGVSTIFFQAGDLMMGTCLVTIPLGMAFWPLVMRFVYPRSKG